jgi:ferredoxin-nitrite reductase
MQTAGSFRSTALPQRPQHPAAARPSARQQAALQRPSAIAAPSRPAPGGAKAEVIPLAEELKPLVEEKGVDWEKSGLKYLSNDARARALDKKANKPEKLKLQKDGSVMWTEVHELAELVRSGKADWKDLNIDDVDVRLKWAGLFHRKKRTPGRFMMRLKVPNGELTAEQLRYMGGAIRPFGADGCADITTRANVQLRGMTLAEADKIFDGLQAIGLSSVSTGMDSVRNMTTSPISGIDPHELLDVRQLSSDINAMYTNNGKGNVELSNLPRKINIALSPSRDDFPHTHINDVGLVAVKHPETGEVGFNLEVGGYFSIKRNAVSFDGDTFIRQDQVVAYCKALLEVFRDHGGRMDRQKARLMWLVEDWGVDKFREAIAERMGDTLSKGVHVEYNTPWARRDVLGIHPQKQDGLFWVGVCVPAGRFFADDFDGFADIAEKYGDGTVRLTVEQNLLFPNIPEDRLDEMRQEPLFQKYPIEAGPLARGLVSCTGSQFCGIALIETKQRALAVVEKLEAQLDIPPGIRMHWTGCPNSCGQAQVADIGLMGCPAKKDGKAVEGVRIFLGGTIGEHAALASEFEKGIPCEEEILLPKLQELLIEKFGATAKA